MNRYTLDNLVLFLCLHPSFVFQQFVSFVVMGTSFDCPAALLTKFILCPMSVDSVVPATFGSSKSLWIENTWIQELWMRESVQMFI